MVKKNHLIFFIPIVLVLLLLTMVVTKVYAANTQLSITVLLHGIGKGGDSSNPNSGGNTTPKNATRNISVGVFNAQNVLVSSRLVVANYDAASGSYKATVDFGNLSTGPYNVAIRADKYLQKNATGIQNITAGQINTIPPVNLIAGDIIIDNAINIQDFNMLMNCYSDLRPAKACTAAQSALADLTDDGKVNQLDYNLFIREIGNRSGESNPTTNPSPSAPPTASSGDFPRLGGMLIGSPQNYDEAAYQQQIAKLDMAVLGMYPGWNRGGKTMAKAVSEIKAKNASIKLANYTIMTEVNNTSDPATAAWRTKLSAEKGPNGKGDWWAYNSSGQHTDWSGGSYSAWDTNVTLQTTVDTNGDKWPQWKAKHDYQTLYQGNGFDFWYSDNNFWKPRTNADWNRDGTNDSADSVAVRNWWRDGQKAYYTTAKSIAPNTPVMVNTDNDLDGTVFPSDADDFTQYKNLVGAAFMEHAMGVDWSTETWGGWATTMNWYRKLKSNLTAPQYVMFDVYVPNTSDYQYLRYAFATCLMDDGYFSASTDYNKIVWFDEFDLAGTKSTKWLGKAVDGPRTSAWQNGVYRRNFQNGIVLVNPKGNGTKTVTIESGYRRFQGKQAPSVNNGQPVTTVTLNDRDGLFLVKN